MQKTLSLNIVHYIAIGLAALLALAGLSMAARTIAHADTTDTSSSTATSTTSTTASTTTMAAPMISNIGVTSSSTGATITWTTDQAASTQVAYGLTSNYSASSTLDSNLITNHSVMLSNLTPSTTYFYQIMSGNASSTMATSTSATFMTLAAPVTGTTTGTTTTGTTASSTDPVYLQSVIDALRSQVTSLQNQLLWYQNNWGMGTSTGTTTGTGGNGTGMTGGATINPASASITSGGSMDFNGRNFGHEENVSVMQNGNLVTTAHADGGGNFSTGSLQVSGTGPQTFTFTGANSGTVLTSTVNVGS